MELTLDELLHGKATRIRGKEFFSTAAYVEPFLERVSRLTSNFRVQVKLPSQITYTEDGNINTEDITYNRVLVEAILPDEFNFNNDPHRPVIGMVYGIDVRKPVIKFFKGQERRSCTNLCVFDPELLTCQELAPEAAVDYRPLTRIIDQTDDTADWLKRLTNTDFDCSVQNVTKLAVSTPIDAYKSLFEKKESEYYTGFGSTTTMYRIYNAFTQEITNAMEKDAFSIFEKTVLLKDILDF